MFETEIVPAGPPTLVRFLLQQLFVPSVLLVIGLVLLAPIEPRGYEVGLQGVWTVIYAYPSVFGFALAFFVNSKWSRFRPTGRWVWVVPALAWTYNVWSPSASISLSDRLEMRFAPTGILLIMETIPTLGCICYSVGMIAAERRRTQERPDGRE